MFPNESKSDLPKKSVSFFAHQARLVDVVLSFNFVVTSISKWQ